MDGMFSMIFLPEHPSEPAKVTLQSNHYNGVGYSYRWTFSGGNQRVEIDLIKAQDNGILYIIIKRTNVPFMKVTEECSLLLLLPLVVEVVVIVVVESALPLTISIALQNAKLVVVGAEFHSKVAVLDIDAIACVW